MMKSEEIFMGIVNQGDLLEYFVIRSNSFKSKMEKPEK